MGGCGATEGDRARRTPAMLMPIVRAWGDFPIATVQDNRQVDPRMVMERPVVIRAQHLVEVDVDEPISRDHRSQEHTSELQSLMRTSYAVFCLQRKNRTLKPPAGGEESSL